MLSKIVGMLIALACIFGGFHLMGGTPGMLLKPVEILIIYGSGLGAIYFSQTKQSGRIMLDQFKNMNNKDFSKEKNKQLLILLRDIIEFKRKRSAKELEYEIDNSETAALFSNFPLIRKDKNLFLFITDNIRYLTNAKPDTSHFAALMQDEINTINHEQVKPSYAVSWLADACPGLGVLAAVLGILMTLMNIDGDIAAIGLGIATALSGTFLGMFGCYVLFKPMAASLANNVEDNMVSYAIVKKVLCELCANKSALMAVDAGRRLINSEFKPSFAELETWFDQAEPIRGGA